MTCRWGWCHSALLFLFLFHLDGRSILTCLWAYTTLPSSFHVPPRRSIRTIRRIWKNRRPRKALVANTWPDVPMPITTIDAPIVITSIHCPMWIQLIYGHSNHALIWWRRMSIKKNKRLIVNVMQFHWNWSKEIEGTKSSPSKWQRLNEKPLNWSVFNSELWANYLLVSPSFVV